MKIRYLIPLLLCLPMFAQSWSGQSTSNARVVPPYRFCLGQDNGQDVCMVQNGVNAATLFGTLNLTNLNVTGTCTGCGGALSGTGQPVVVGGVTTVATNNIPKNDIRWFMSPQFGMTPTQVNAQDMGAVFAAAFLATAGGPCVDASALNAVGTIYMTTNPYAGGGTLTNPCIEGFNGQVVIGSTVSIPAGSLTMQGGVPSTLGTGFNWQLCNTNGGCNGGTPGAITVPQFPSANTCATAGGINCWPTGMPSSAQNVTTPTGVTMSGATATFTVGSAYSSVWTVGALFTATGFTPSGYNGWWQITGGGSGGTTLTATAIDGTSALGNSSIQGSIALIAQTYTTGTVTLSNSSPVVVGAGTTFDSGMVGGLLISGCAANSCAFGGGTATYATGRVVAFTDAAHITLASTPGAGASAQHFILVRPNTPIALCDVCLTSSELKAGTGRLFRNVGIDLNGVQGAVGYYTRAVQEGTEYDNFVVTLQQNAGPTTEAGACMGFDNTFRESNGATQTFTGHYLGLSIRCGAGQNVAGSLSWGIVAQGFSLMDGTVGTSAGSGPGFFQIAAIIGGGGSHRFQDDLWIDGLFDGRWYGAHMESVLNDIVNVGPLNPVYGNIIEGIGSSGTMGNAVVEFQPGTSGNIALGINRPSGGKLIVDDNLATPTVATSTAGTPTTWTAAPYLTNAAGAVLTGTGACATITTQTGGAVSGSAKCTGTTGASTLTITFGIPAATGWTCNVYDETTRANLFQQTSHSTTACVLTVTSVTQNDVFSFSAQAF